MRQRAPSLSFDSAGTRQITLALGTESQSAPSLSVNAEICIFSTSLLCFAVSKAEAVLLIPPRGRLAALLAS